MLRMRAFQFAAHCSFVAKSSALDDAKGEDGGKEEEDEEEEEENGSCCRTACF